MVLIDLQMVISRHDRKIIEYDAKQHTNKLSLTILEKKIKSSVKILFPFGVLEQKRNIFI